MEITLTNQILNMEKKKYRILILLAGVFLIGILSFFIDPGLRILKEGKGTFYLNLYSKIMPSEKFNSLLKELIRDNNDIHSLNQIASFVSQNPYNEMLPLLEERCEYFKGFPKDSSWVVPISYSYSRVSNIEMLAFDNSFCKTINDM